MGVSFPNFCLSKLKSFSRLSDFRYIDWFTETDIKWNRSIILYLLSSSAIFWKHPFSITYCTSQMELGTSVCIHVCVNMKSSHHTLPAVFISHLLEASLLHDVLHLPNGMGHLRLRPRPVDGVTLVNLDDLRVKLLIYYGSLQSDPSFDYHC